MGFRSDFYGHLAEEVYDFDLDRDGISALPFLASQMEDLKTFAQGSAVSIIKSLREQFQNKEIGEKEYFCSILEVAMRKRIRIREQIFMAIENCRNMFPLTDTDADDLALSSASDSNKRKRLFYKRAQRILDSMRSVPDQPQPGCDEALNELSRLLLAEALVAEAKAWLYDSGFPSRNSRDPGSRKIDRSIQLIDRFFAERNEASYFFDSIQLPGAAQLADPGAASVSLKDEAQTLFSLMCRDPVYSRSVVPITIDPSSGTGLYIYGIESDDMNISFAFENNRVLQRLVSSEGYSCYYTVFEYRYSDRIYDGDYPETGSARLIYLQHVINEGSDDECVGYPDIEDAWHDYVQIISKNDSYISYENVPAPQGCPDRFRQYFPHDDETDSRPDQKHISEEDDSEVKLNRKDVCSSWYHSFNT